MKVAKLINGSFLIQSIYEMYPQVSFSNEGIPDDFLQENNLFKVVDIPVYDITIHKIVLLETPVIKNNLVYTFRIEEKTEIEKNNDLWVNLRLSRDVLLRQSDKFVFADMWEKYTEEQKNSWRQYRQMLRDLPQNTDITKNVIWPNWPIRTESTTTSL